MLITGQRREHILNSVFNKGRGIGDSYFAGRSYKRYTRSFISYPDFSFDHTVLYKPLHYVGDS